METDELIGRTFGHYRVVKQLGEGGMAVVYQAEDTHLRRLVAVKVLKIFLSGSAQEFGQRFEREAMALARLQHPNIVSVLDYGSLDNRYPYLVMPFLTGGTLEDRVGSPFHYTRAAELLAPIADALAYAHRAGFIHRDVKPSNILLTESGKPLLSDFGIARLTEDATRTKLTASGAALGTPGYLAPEQWTGSSLPQTDVYALGMVFYELVTGHNPYTSDTPQVVLYKQMMQSLTAPRSLIPNLPVEVENALMKALYRAPEDRYASMADFAQVLQKIAVNDLAGVSSLVGQSQTFHPDFPLIPGDAPTRPADSVAVSALGQQAAPQQVVPPSEVPKVTVLLNETVPVDSLPGGIPAQGGFPGGGVPAGNRPGKISDPGLPSEMKKTPTSLGKMDVSQTPRRRSTLPLVLLGLGSLAVLAVAAVVLVVTFLPRLLGSETAATGKVTAPTRTVVASSKATPSDKALAAPTQAEATRPPAADGPVSLVWLMPQDEQLQQWANTDVLPALRQANPNITVNLEVVPAGDFDAALKTKIAGGDPPDIWMPNGMTGFREFVQNGEVADLSPFIAADGFDLADFEPTAINAYTVDGKLYALPRSTSGTYLFFNKDLFDRSGVPYPTADWDDSNWTWDSFLWKCKAMTSTNVSDPSKDVFGCFLDIWPKEGITLLWGKDIFPEAAYQTGFADTAFLDDPLAIEAFEARQNLVWDMHYMPTDDQGAANGGLNLFTQQKVAMVVTGGWGWWYLRDSADFNWGVAALPFGAEGRRDVVYTDVWLLSSQSKHPREAWELLKAMTSPGAQEAWMGMRQMAPARISLAEKWYNAFPGMDAELARQAHTGALRYGLEQPGAMLVRYSELNSIISSAADAIFSNERSAAEALPEANQALVDNLHQIQTEFRR